MVNPKDLNMTEGPFLKKIFIFAIPLILNSLLQTTYGAADSFVAGRFISSEALAAVSSNGPLWSMLVFFFIGITSSSGILIARCIGAKDTRLISKAVHTSIAMSLIFGVFIFFVGIIFSRVFLTWMNVPDNIIDLSTLYLRISFIGCPASMFFNSIASIFRGRGDSKTPLVIQSTTGLINCTLNVIFVTVFKWSVAGVAASTVISQYISAIWFGILLSRCNDDCKFYIRKIRIYKNELAEILRIGLPSGVTQIAAHIVNIITQAILNGFGPAVMAGCSVSSTILNAYNSVSGGFVQSASVMTSQNYGAKSKNNIKKIVLECSTIVFIVSAVILSLFFVFKRELLGLFTTDQATIDAGAERFMYILPPQIIASTLSVFATALISMRRNYAIMVYGLCMNIGFHLVWCLFIFPLNPVPAMLYVRNIITPFISLIFYPILYTHTLKHLDFE